MRGVLARLFVNARPGAVVAVSLLAGFGEELLFGGVLQNLLAGTMPIELATLLAGIAFGLAHYVNGVYFVVATLLESTSACCTTGRAICSLPAWCTPFTTGWRSTSTCARPAGPAACPRSRRRPDG